MFFRALLTKLFGLREKTDSDQVKPFLDHLEDLRWMLVKMALTLSLSITLSFAYRFQLTEIIKRPLLLLNDKSVYELKTYRVAESVGVSVNLAFYAGFILAFPFLLYFLAQFILPALNTKEKKYVLPAVGVGFGLFLSGVYFCFRFILPATLLWMYYDAKHMGFDPYWTAGEYFSFASNFVLIFGVMFELPVVVVALIKIGVLEASLLQRTRAYGLIIILVAAMIIAPAADPISMFIVAGPMYVLYELCIWLAWGMERRERRLAARAARLAAAQPPAPAPEPEDAGRLP